MSLNVEIKSNIHNRFDIFKENVKTGVKEQVGYAENIVLDAMWPRLCSGSTYFINIHYGTGTGTLSAARTSLFSHLGTGAASTVETVRAIPTSYWRRSITLGLTTANGNTLTEVGIAYGTGSTNLVTHAQIRDMNGNPTGIVKTDVDIITIYATVYITLVNDHASIKLLHPNNNGLLSYLLGGSFPSAVFSAGMSDKSLDWPAGLISYTIGSSGTGSWSADVANKKRVTSTMRFETAVDGHIKELAFSNIARLLLPATGIYSGLELSDVPIGVGDGVTDTFDLPSAYIDWDSIVAKVDGLSASVVKSSKNLVYKMASVTGGNPPNKGTGVAFSPDGTIMAVVHDNSPYVIMYENIDGVWTKMPNVTGGLPAGNGNGVAFSPDSTIMAVAHHGSPFVTMYENISGVWTKMPNVTGGYPSYNGTGVAFSPDGTIMAVVHDVGTYVTMYENISGVWTKMPNVTGGYPPGGSYGVAFSPDSTIMAVAHHGSPYVTMYENISGVWTKMPNVTGGNPADSSYSIAFSPDGTIMAVVHFSGLCVTTYSGTSIITQITFAAAPADGAVITADYTVNGIHKTDQRVIDISGEIQFGEPT